MGYIILGLYILGVTALVIGIYNLVLMQDIIQINKLNLQNKQRTENRLYSLEKILNNKKWTWK